MASNKGPAKLEAEIAELGDLPRGDLVERWTSLHGNAPPQRLTQDLLVRNIAYELQARELGGLNAVEKKSLAAFAAGRASLGPKNLPTGTRLYRSWQGVTHEVLVSEGSYSWKGQSYTSLSQVARAITGTRWSGPRFFGVTT